MNVKAELCQYCTKGQREAGVVKLATDRAEESCGPRKDQPSEKCSVQALLSGTRRALLLSVCAHVCVILVLWGHKYS